MLWERNCPRHHTGRSLPSVKLHSLGRENWRARSGLKVKGVEPDKGQRGGPSHSVTNIVHRNTRWEGLGGHHTSSRMSPDPQRWGEIRLLISSGNRINYPSTEGLFVSRKTLLIRVHNSTQIVSPISSTGKGSPVNVCVQCEHWTHTVKFFLVSILKGRWTECLQNDWPWNNLGHLGDIPQPGVQKCSCHTRRKLEIWWGHW